MPPSQAVAFASTTTVPSRPGSARSPAVRGAQDAVDGVLGRGEVLLEE